MINTELNYLELLEDKDKTKEALINLGYKETDIDIITNKFKPKYCYYNYKTKEVVSIKITEEDLEAIIIPNYFRDKYRGCFIRTLNYYIEGTNNFYFYKDIMSYDTLAFTTSLKKNKPIFIVNTPLDYITLYLLKGKYEELEGIQFIAVSDAKKFINLFKEYREEDRKDYQFILMLGYNERANNLTTFLKEELDKLNMFNYVLGIEKYNFNESITELYKDNEEDLKTTLIDITKNYLTLKIKEEEAIIKELRAKYTNKFSISNHIQAFKSKVENNELNKVIATTGFTELDKALGGGITPYLYTIGAVSSLGKTTLLLQIANNIAKTTDNDILFFSLEMNKYDLISKTLANESFLTEYKKGGNSEVIAKDLALSRKDISQAKRESYFTEAQKDKKKEAYNNYLSYASKMFILDREDIETPTITEIIRLIEEHKANTGKYPIVIIDYLQILKPSKEDIRLSEYEKINNIVDALMNLSHRKKIAIILIQSYGRANYFKASTIASGKGSGNIEYSSDILLSLDFYNIAHKKELYELDKTNNKDFNEGSNEALNERNNESIFKKCKKENPRKIALSILKNRAGRSEIEIDFNYYPANDTFIEDKETTYKSNLEIED